MIPRRYKPLDLTLPRPGPSWPLNHTLHPRPLAQGRPLAETRLPHLAARPPLLTPLLCLPSPRPPPSNASGLGLSREGGGSSEGEAAGQPGDSNPGDCSPGDCSPADGGLGNGGP